MSKKTITLKLSKRQVQAVLSAAGTWLGEIDEYKSDISNLESQLEELDSQLISTLDELKRTSKKLILSSSKVKVLEDQIFSIQQKHDEIETKLIQSDSINSANEKEIKSLRDELANTLIELELSQFELELLEEQL